MSFVIPCPHCGPRSVYEFRFGGEVKARPNPEAPHDEWLQYIYTKTNSSGVQQEWWYHRSGCRQWLRALRNTATNEVTETWLPD
jgi:sarcosine oxidase subunit delta